MDMKCFVAINGELERQEEKWGTQQHSDMTWVAILVEEVGEAAQAALETERAPTSELTEEWELRLLEEVVQVTAVAVRWLEHVERRRARRRVLMSSTM